MHAHALSIFAVPPPLSPPTPKKKKYHQGRTGPILNRSVAPAPSFSQDVEETEAADAEPVTDLSNSDVTTKYQEASKIANLAIQGVVQQCVAGARVNALCKFGDTVMEQVCLENERW